MRRTIFFAVLLASATGFAAACALDESDCTFDGTCLGASSGNVPDSADGQDVTTDPCLETPTEPKCLEETKALFVSASKGGDTSGDGSRSKPFKTIGAALAKVDANRKRIYICEGTYGEDLALTNAHSGVSLFGGVSCEWTPAPGVRPVIGASANPMSIKGAQGVALVDIAVEAKDALDGSSIALFADSADIVVRGSKIVGGAVAAKAPSGTLEAHTFPPQASLNGFNAPDASSGGPEKLVTCPGGSQTKGGNGGIPGDRGQQGTPGPDNRGAIGGCGATPSGTGGDGIQGTAGPGGEGAKTLGELTGSGWKPSDGARGNDGVPGQGGGGGFGTGGAGGGGGAGGCGGAGGGGGRAGAASIAIAVIATKLTVQKSELIARTSGAGGDGVVGQPGQNDIGFRGNGTGGACPGGNGGKGGAGGAGGGGAGGVSAGVLYKAGSVDVDDATRSRTTVGTQASGGKGGDEANKGIDGVSVVVLEAPN